MADALSLQQTGAEPKSDADSLAQGAAPLRDLLLLLGSQPGKFCGANACARESAGYRGPADFVTASQVGVQVRRDQSTHIEPEPRGVRFHHPTIVALPATL